jgi:hypothetical protein
LNWVSGREVKEEAKKLYGTGEGSERCKRVKTQGVNSISSLGPRGREKEKECFTEAPGK